ncbi:MAG TPA: zinc ribbon domain-containing protein [Candidatus Dormibacteraeota bacterium]
MAAVVYCGNCGAPNPPGAAFCGRCGNAIARGAPVAAVPVPAAVSGPAPVYAGGYVLPSYQPVPYRQAVTVKTQWWVWAVAAGLIGLFMLALLIVALTIGPGGVIRCIGPSCQRVRLAPPLGAPHRYTSSALGFSVEYYDHPELQGHLKVSSQDASSIAWEIDTRSGNFPWVLAGEKAGGRSGQQIVQALQQSKFGDAQYLYTVPGVTFGATPGFGNVYRIGLQANGGQTFEGRLVVSAAVKSDIALEVVAIGPYVKSTPSDGHPNPSNTFITELADETLKNVYWPGDPEL